MTLFQKTETAITRAAAFVAILGGMGLIFATLATCISIILKLIRRMLDATLGGLFETVPWAFIRPILGEEELVTYGVGLALFCALPWVMIRKGHITIDLLAPLFGKRLNRVLDLLGDLSLAALAWLILTRQWFLIFKKARRSQEPMATELLNGNFGVLGERLRDSQESQILGIPLWPTWVVAEICIILFFLVACFCVLRSARALIRGGAA